jgi:hypothetical protein
MMAANYSPDRRARALEAIRRADASGLRSQTREEQTLYAIGTLICDDSGFITQAQIDSAWDDPTVVQVARTLLKEAEQIGT